MKRSWKLFVAISCLAASPCAAQLVVHFPDSLGRISQLAVEPLPGMNLQTGAALRSQTALAHPLHRIIAVPSGPSCPMPVARSATPPAGSDTNAAIASTAVPMPLQSGGCFNPLDTRRP